MSKQRSYSSPLRVARAAATRESVQRAASQLFATQGFAATTVNQIADEAGVSAQTVYAVFGSKAALVASMLEFFQRESGINETQAAIGNEGDPQKQLRIFVHSIRHLFELGADVFSVVLEAPSQPELAIIREQGDGARLDACRGITSMWKANGALPSGVDVEATAETMWLLTSLEAYLASTRELNRTPDEHEEWVFRSLNKLLFT